MEWIRLHPYASALAAAGLLVILGAVVVVQRMPASSVANPTSVWNGGGSSIQNSAVPTMPSSEQNSPQQIAAEVIQNQSPTNLNLSQLTDAATSASATPAPSQPNYLALLAQMSAQSSSGTSASSSAAAQASANQTIAQAYAFIPQGFVATTTASQKPLTADQKALYDYGNEVGAIIQSFERQNPNQAQTLKNQVEDRSDSTKIAAVVTLGKNLAQVGEEIQQLGDVPPAAQSYNTALAQSYQEIGAKLQLVPVTQSDQAFVSAIETYDAAADTFTRNYAALASYFVVAGVTFSPQDAGSEFSFTNAQSLSI